MKLVCDHYTFDSCRSCQWIETSYTEQLKQKQSHFNNLLAKTSDFGTSTTKNNSVLEILPPQSSNIQSFRNKAKMVVLGAAHEPTLGIINHHDEIVSLTDCPLYSKQMQELLKYLESWIQQSGIPPYNINKQKGELKYILVHENRQGEFLIRFVVRSLDRQDRFDKNFEKIIEVHPSVKVVTINIQAEHQAILEGPEEIYLTNDEFITETLNDIPLCIQPGCFFQTNSEMAEKLYQRACEWIYEFIKADLDEKSNIEVQDLFCGVGGFGLSVSKYLQDRIDGDIDLLGIEISPSAQKCAHWTAEQIGLKNVSFKELDLTMNQIKSSVSSTNYTQAKQNSPKYSSAQKRITIVNPPRRGIGPQVCDWIEGEQSDILLYSSCNAETMVKDLDQLPSYELIKSQVFDMFPHSSHYEVLIILKLRGEP